MNTDKPDVVILPTTFNVDEHVTPLFIIAVPPTCNLACVVFKPIPTLPAAPCKIIFWLYPTFCCIVCIVAGAVAVGGNIYIWYWLVVDELSAALISFEIILLQ